MNIVDRVGAGLSQVVEGIVESNRKYAQLNRLNMVIKAEMQTLDKAYAALGKHYYASLNGEKSEEEIDIAELGKKIESAKARLKKAQERYVYIEKNGMSNEECKPKIVPVEVPVEQSIDEEDYDDGDITICCSDDSKIENVKPSVDEKVEKSEE